MIRKLRDGDADAVLAIYAQGIATRLATFETALPEWGPWIAGKLPHSRFVYLEGGVVAGWALLSPVSAREAYAGVAEVSVYVAEGSRRKGIGERLLSTLVESSEENGVWTLAAVIIDGNEASVRLHERCGFRLVGRRERIARLDGTWRDTLLFERRSPRI